MDKNFTFLNGEYVPFNQSFLHVSDLAVTRGYAVFDFFLVQNGVPRYLSFHLDRFIKSAALLNLDLPYSKGELAALIEKLIDKNGLRNSSVKIILTGGFSMDDFTISKPSFIVINKPFEVLVTDAHKNGGSLITCNYQREIPEAKTINYLRSVSLSKQIMEANASEILYTSRNWVRECSRSNVYMVNGDTVLTPKSGILKGITRKRLLELNGCKIVEENFKLDDLLAADEVFITSTTKGVLPITRIDSKIISDGKAGLITKALQKAIMHEQ
jgi:D-alanine transaminase/branched-chain amino acid aminotransferase